MCDSCCEAPVPGTLPDLFCPQCWNIPCTCASAGTVTVDLRIPVPMTKLPLPEALPGQTVARGIALMHNTVVDNYNALLSAHTALLQRVQVLEARVDTHCRNADARDNGHT